MHVPTPATLSNSRAKGPACVILTSIRLLVVTVFIASVSNAGSLAADSSTSRQISTALADSGGHTERQFYVKDGADDFLYLYLAVPQSFHTSKATRSIMVDAVQEIVNVSSAAELMAALSNAQGGETILLAPGNYGALDLRNLDISSEVILTSAQPDDPATITGLSLREVTNLTFDGITFDYSAAPGAVEDYKPFLITSSVDITIRNSTFDGDMATEVSDAANGYATGFGLFVVDSSQITLHGNEFFDWMRGAVFARVDNLTVSDNDIHGIRSDGLNFAQVNGVLIENNYLHDFRGAVGTADHLDMIQFWTNGTSAPSSDIVIRGNFLDSGEGSWTQSIFMRNDMVDRGLAGSEMYYSNILIEDNVIYNAHTHGITVGETYGLEIRNNTILQNLDSAPVDDPVYVPWISVEKAAEDVVITGNIVPRLGEMSTAADWTVENNLVVQRTRPDGENYVGDLFVNALAGSQATLGDLRALPSGLAEQLGVGSKLTQFDTTPETPTGYIVTEAGTGLGLSGYLLDASNLFGPSGAVDLTGADVMWDFGDGNTASGPVLNHSWQSAGTYDVSVTVTLAGGDVLELNKTVHVQTPLALNVNFNDSPDDLSDQAHPVVVSEHVRFEGTADDLAMRLNGGDVKYEKSADFLNNSEYSLFIDFKKDLGNEDSGGTVVYFASSFLIKVAGDGVSVSLTTDKGTDNLGATKLGITDSDWHRLAITFSGKDGSAVLYLDGDEVARLSDMKGAMQVGSQYHDLYLGDPWGNGFAGLIDNLQFWKGAMSAEQIQALSVRAEDGKFVPLESTTAATVDDTTIEPVDDTTTEPVDDTTTEPVDDTTTEPVDDTTIEPVDDTTIEPVDDTTIEPVDDTTTEPVDDTTTGSVDDGTKVGPGRSEPLLENRGKGWKDKDAAVTSDATSPQDGGEQLIASYGGAGDDTIKGTGGNDELLGRDGNDRLFGGPGNDRLGGGDGNDVLRGGLGDDWLFGGKGSDRLVGGDGNDVLRGGPENDRLIGGSGNDRLMGGDGNDVLVGGLGRDVLTGGRGADTFMFKDESDSLPGGADRITDFSRGQGDQIRLSGIDANVNAAGNDSFVFIETTGFSGSAGELRYFVNSQGHAIVRGDTDGDGQADFQLVVTDTSVLQANDFNL